jgi:uncharacterized protein
MLKDQLYADIITAMKAGDRLKADALKMVKAEIMKYEVSAENMVADDEVVVGILTREMKRRKEAARGFEEGGNAEMAAKELEEAALYSAYLPELMSEDEVREVVKATVEEMGVSDISAMGQVMGAVMGKLQGKADGGMVKDVVKDILG